MRTVITQETTKKLSVLRVPSPLDLPSLLTGALVPPVNASRHEELRGQWAGIHTGWQWGDVASLDDVTALFAAGWDAGAEKARGAIAALPLADLTPEALVMKRKRVYRDAGDTVRIESALAGDWDRAFEGRAKRLSAAPAALSVCCAFGAQGDVGHDEFFWTGVQMTCLTDLLEGQGWRVELRAVKANEMGSAGTHVQDITVKLADQPMRDDAVMALFGHAGVYRVYGWAGNLHTSTKVPYGMGTVLTGKELTAAVGKAADAGMIHPASLIVPQAYSRDAAIANLRAALASVRALATGAAA
jgi:hypothetical protein